MNLATIIDEHPAESQALISRGKPTNYGTLRSEVDDIRTGLIDLGLSLGDRVAILAGNTRYFVETYLAVLGAGAVAIPMNPTLPPQALAQDLATVQPRAIVVGPAARKSFQQIPREELPTEFIIGAGFTPADGYTLEELGDGLPTAPVVDCDPDDLAALIFTSGTAGMARPAMLSHGNLFTNIRQILATGGVTQDETDVAFGVVPLFHIFGLNVILGVSLYLGSSTLLIERFDPNSAIEAIEKHNVSVISGPPTMWAAWANMPNVDASHFEHVRMAVSGAAKLPAHVHEMVKSRLSLDLEEGYGLTEASPVVTSPTGTDAPVGSIGIPVPGLEVRLVDTNGDDVLVGDPGEIWVKGPNVFRGYWNDPEATERVLTPDGWLRTGDVGLVDEHGFIYLVDRVKDLIIVSGFNVFPAEVEAVLDLHPAVITSGVVGVPHPYTGEAVKAYVVTRPGVSVDEEDIVAFCNERLAAYKCPNKVWFVDEIPMGLTGKVLRKQLRENGIQPQ